MNTAPTQFDVGPAEPAQVPDTDVFEPRGCDDAAQLSPDQVDSIRNAVRQASEFMQRPNCTPVTPDSAGPTGAPPLDSPAPGPDTAPANTSFPLVDKVNDPGGDRGPFSFVSADEYFQMQIDDPQAAEHQAWRIVNYASSELTSARTLFGVLGITEAEVGSIKVRLADQQWLSEHPPTTAGSQTWYSPQDQTIVIGWDLANGKSSVHQWDLLKREYAMHVVTKLRPDLSSDYDAQVVRESLADSFAGIFMNDFTFGERSADGPARSAEINFGDRRQNPFMVQQYVEGGTAQENSTIPTRAAWLTNKMLGMDATARIYANALRNHLDASPDINSLAAAVQRSATELYGVGSMQERAVVRAWQGVGVNLQSQQVGA